MKRGRYLLATIILLLSPAAMQAQLLDPVSYSVEASPDRVKAGEVFTITVRAGIDGEWHLYSAHNDPDAGPYPTTFTVTGELFAKAGQITETEPKIVLDPNFNEKLGWHGKEARFTIPVAFMGDQQGEQQLEIDILYQVCDDRSCLPPKTKSVSAIVVVDGISDDPYQLKSEDSSIIQFDSLNDTSTAIGFVMIFLVFIFAGVYLFSRLR